MHCFFFFRIEKKHELKYTLDNIIILCDNRIFWFSFIFPFFFLEYSLQDGNIILFHHEILFRSVIFLTYNITLYRTKVAMIDAWPQLFHSKKHVFLP